MIAVVADGAANGHAINVYVDGRHENGNLFAFAFQVFGFFGLFNHNYFPISRSNNLFGIFLNGKNWVSEKLKYDQVENHTYTNHDVADKLLFWKEVIECPYNRHQND